MAKVLVVEDNALNLKLFNDLLTFKKYEIINSRDGVDVIHLVHEQKPDIILMDIQINGEAMGLELIKQLKSDEITKTIPLIAVTAFVMKSDEARIWSAGCDMYLSKPVSIDVFFSVIDKFLSITK